MSHSRRRARLYESTLEKLELMSDLDSAVQRSEFTLQYQPMIVLDSGDIAGMEALVRWQHPSRGRIQPLQFIRLAEESGAIVALGEWVLRELCRRATEWQSAYPSDPTLSMSVNVSVRQLTDHQFIELVGSPRVGARSSKPDPGDHRERDDAGRRDDDAHPP